MLNRIRNEPALVSGLVVVLLNLGAAFGLNLTSGQTGAINAAVAAVLAIAFVRPRVIPTRKVDPDLLTSRVRNPRDLGHGPRTGNPGTGTQPGKYED